MSSKKLHGEAVIWRCETCGLRTVMELSTVERDMVIECQWCHRRLAV